MLLLVRNLAIVFQHCPRDACPKPLVLHVDDLTSSHHCHYQSRDLLDSSVGGRPQVDDRNVWSLVVLDLGHVDEGLHLVKLSMR